MTTASLGDIPLGVPVLTRGKHRDPAEGSCLMEYVSVLAGLRFTDRPRCTHPLLSWLARRVNDGTSDVARPQLAGLAPALIGTRVHHWGARAVLRAVVYADLSAVGLVAAPRDRWLRELDELATSHLARCPGAHASPSLDRSTNAVVMVGRRRWQTLGTFDRNVTFGVVYQALSRLRPEERDRLLGAALASSVARSRRLLGLPDVAVTVLAGRPPAAPRQ